MRLIQITSRPCHLHIAGFRVHHYFTGSLIVAFGLALMFDDRRDWRAWLPARPWPTDA